MRRLWTLQTAIIALAACPLVAGCVGATFQPATGALADSKTRQALDREYAAACERSDTLHQGIQATVTRPDR